jgi:uncharacterized protein YbjT (DUF2867 family)
MTASTAFVAGATGLTGRHVVAALRSRDIPTIAHVRPDSSRLAEWTERFEALGARVDSTAWEFDAMAATMEIESPSVVFSLLGTTQKRKSTSGDPASNTYEAVDYGLTHLLLTAASRSGTPRFVYLSSLGADGGRGAYLDVRKRIEAELAGGSLPWTSIRPAIIHGERDESRLGEAIGASLGDGLLGLVGALGGSKLRDKYQSIQASDLAAGIVRWALDPSGANRIVETEDLR